MLDTRCFNLLKISISNETTFSNDEKGKHSMTAAVRSGVNKPFCPFNLHDTHLPTDMIMTHHAGWLGGWQYKRVYVYVCGVCVCYVQ